MFDAFHIKLIYLPQFSAKMASIPFVAYKAGSLHDNLRKLSAGERPRSSSLRAFPTEDIKKTAPSPLRIPSPSSGSDSPVGGYLLAFLAQAQGERVQEVSNSQPPQTGLRHRGSRRLVTLSLPGPVSDRQLFKRTCSPLYAVVNICLWQYSHV